MDIRRTRFDGTGNELVNEADDRRLTRKVLEPLGIFFGRFAISNDLAELRATFSPLLGFGIKAVERGFELERNSDGDRHGPTDRRGDRIADKPVERIGHGQNDTSGRVCDR